MDWHTQIEKVQPHVIRITTPEISGTGFLVRRQKNKIGIATASHVIRDAVAWGQEIVIHHPSFETSLQLLNNSRHTILHPSLDSAYIEADLPEILEGQTFPEEPINQVSTGQSVKPGVEVGWLGFPSIVPGQEPCFFSGCVSKFYNRRYFIDGVAIPGVSGGPAFLHNSTDDSIYILGSITAYTSSSVRGDTIPSLMVADECGHWREVFENR